MQMILVLNRIKKIVSESLSIKIDYKILNQESSDGSVQLIVTYPL